MTEGVIQYNFMQKIPNSKYYNRYITFNPTCQSVNKKIAEHIDALKPKKYLSFYCAKSDWTLLMLAS